MRFEGKSVVVTGAAHGIGRATAARFLSEGARVALLDVEAAGLEWAAKETDAYAIECDLMSPSSVDAAMASALETLGGIDVLVNVAGGAADVQNELAEDYWAQDVGLNLNGSVRLLRAALPAVRESGGNVVVVSSVNALSSFGNLAYSSAKAGLVSLIKNLAADLGPEGVRLNAVAPGSVNTRAWDWSENGANVMGPTIAPPRVGEPEDVAAAVAFLASDDAAWITGAVLPVDGGQTLGPRVLINHQLRAMGQAPEKPGGRPSSVD